MCSRKQLLILAAVVAVSGCNTNQTNTPPTLVAKTEHRVDQPTTLGDKRGAASFVPQVKQGDQIQSHHELLAAHALEFGSYTLGGTGEYIAFYLFRDASILQITADRHGKIKTVGAGDPALPEHLSMGEIPGIESTP